MSGKFVPKHQLAEIRNSSAMSAVGGTQFVAAEQSLFTTGFLEK